MGVGSLRETCNVLAGVDISKYYYIVIYSLLLNFFLVVLVLHICGFDFDLLSVM